MPAPTFRPALLTKIARSLARDRDLPLGARLAKGQRYVAASVLGPRRLRGCDRVGARARVIGHPIVRNDGRIEIGDDLVLNAGQAPCELAADVNACLRIGDRVGINFGVLISAARSVTIGDDVSIGPYTIIADAEQPDGSDAVPVVIAGGVWLAGRVTVCPGARIGAGSVITAGSVVRGAIPDGVVAGGNPARVLRRIAATARAADVAEGVAEGVTMTASAATEPALRGVLLADFTTGELAARLGDGGDGGDGPMLVVDAAPYDQVVQTLLAPAAGTTTDFAVVWTRPQQVSAAFRRLMDCEVASDADLLEEVDAFCDAVRQGSAGFRIVLVPTWTLPADERGLGMLDARPGGTAWALARMNHRLMDRLAELPHVFVLDAQRWLADAGGATRSARAWYLGKIAFAPEVMREAARDIKAAVRGAFGQARKLLVLDLDDTLWGGVVGDVGWEHLCLGGHAPEGEALVDFQRAVKRLTRRGVVLAIASKNSEAVALEALRSHPAMVLRAEDFVAWRINWDDKAANIAAIAAELNLGLQSVVFIDDNPVERDRVREALPDVLVPEWPTDKLRYPAAFAALRCFDSVAVSREDAARTHLYADEEQRRAARPIMGSLDEWLAGLGTCVRAERLGGANVTRATQLLNKANQLNLSTRRLTAPEFVAWAEAPGHEVWTVSLSDRFGDAGLTGVLGLQHVDDACRVVDFVLSCRVMGRKVEEVLAHLAVERARAQGASRVDAAYRPTPKNAPCAAFWERSGFARGAEDGLFCWDATEAYPRPGCVSLEWAS